VAPESAENPSAGVTGHGGPNLAFLLFYKMLFHFKALLWESIILVLLPHHLQSPSLPYCKLLSHDHCAIWNIHIYIYLCACVRACAGAAESLHTTYMIHAPPPPMTPPFYAIHHIQYIGDGNIV